MKNLRKAVDLLALKGIESQEMTLVLFAMLHMGVGYAEALRYYADFVGVSRVEMEGRLEEACRAAGRWTGARYILEDCYRSGLYEN